MFPVSAYVFRSKDAARDAHRQQIRSEAIKAIDRAQGDGKRIDLDMEAQIPLIATSPIVNRFTVVPGQVRKLSEAEVKVFAGRIERWKGSTQAMLMSCLPTSGAEIVFAKTVRRSVSEPPEKYEYDRLTQMRENLVSILADIERYVDRALESSRAIECF